MALPLRAMAWTSVYDPTLSQPDTPYEYNDLQDAVDALIGTAGYTACQGIQLQGDWDQDLEITSVRGEDFTIDASGGD